LRTLDFFAVSLLYRRRLPTTCGRKHPLGLVDVNEEIWGAQMAISLPLG
jgi:hypothetical protein